MKKIHGPSDIDEAVITTPDVSQIDESRRHFAKAGLAGSGVILTLASQPVLGSASVRCTISGNLSGNLSRTTVTQPCNSCGKGDDYWEPRDDCKKKSFYDHMGSEYSDSRDSTKDNKCAWMLKPSYENFCLKKDDNTSRYGSGYSSGYAAPARSDAYPSKGYAEGKKVGRQEVDNKGPSAYKDVNTKGKKDGYFDSYMTKYSGWGHKTEQREYQRGYRDGYEERCKEQYGSPADHCKGVAWDFARECLVSMLNCKIKCVDDYGVKEREIKDIWNSCKNGGRYQVRAGVYWSRTDCMNYLKQLHT